MDRVNATIADLALDGLIVIGGEGTLTSASALSDAGLPVIGIPKTIDNDLSGTDYASDKRGFPRFGGIASAIAPVIERRTGDETRVTVLGHVQRGGSPVAEALCDC